LKSSGKGNILTVYLNYYKEGILQFLHQKDQ